MMTRPGVVSIACNFGIGLLALALASPNSPAQAQSADLVLCDRVAADPSDPDKPKDVQGVREIAQSDIATAIKFCRVASAASRRALYQLGRAYAANQQMPDAVSAYRKAADKGSTSAMVELGVMLATGSGVAKDEAQARKLFERAAAGGNPRGATNLAASRAAAAHRRIRPRPAHRRIRSRPEPCSPKRRRRIRRKRSISSD
jgi:TPR repeat protein